MPTPASIKANSTPNHRDRPRGVPPAPRRHRGDSSAGGGVKGTGAPVNADINRRSLPPQVEAPPTGPKGRDDVGRVVGYSPSSATLPGDERRRGSVAPPWWARPLVAPRGSDPKQGRRRPRRGCCVVARQAGAGVRGIRLGGWRRRPESNRCTGLCSASRSFQHVRSSDADAPCVLALCDPVRRGAAEFKADCGQL